MQWGDLPFFGLNAWLRQRFGEKIVKYCLDGGFSCPNRAGGGKGCLFCDETGSGAFAGSRQRPLAAQVEEQRTLTSGKWGDTRFIAYLQNFSGTHAPLATLRQVYEEALALPNSVGLAIATRPDCLPPETVELLAELNARSFLWVELGLQTIHEPTARLLNRGYALPVFDEAVHNLTRHQIPVVVHVILGLPGETREHMRATVHHLNRAGIQGIKFHLLHIHRDTELHQFHQEHPFPLLEQDEYISLVADLLEELDPAIVVHRLTGDGDRRRLVAPRWCLEKKRVFTGIVGELRRRGSRQGARFQPCHARASTPSP